MSSMFRPAQRQQKKLRLALLGPSGSGKTFTALQIAAGLGGRIAVMDTEHGSASLYADLAQFDTFQPDSFEPERYIEAIRGAEEAGYGVIVLDSLSHAWAGKGGLLEFVDKRSAQGGNKFAIWGEATPRHTQLIETMLGCSIHVIATMRTHMKHVQDTDDKGRVVVRKIGMQPVQRDGLEYEFDVVGDLDQANTLAITKTRCCALTDGVFRKPGADVAQILRDWLSAGAPDPADELVARCEAAQTAEDLAAIKKAVKDHKNAGTLVDKSQSYHRVTNAFRAAEQRVAQQPPPPPAPAKSDQRTVARLMASYADALKLEDPDEAEAARDRLWAEVAQALEAGTVREGGGSHDRLIEKHEALSGRVARMTGTDGEGPFDGEDEGEEPAPPAEGGE